MLTHIFVSKCLHIHGNKKRRIPGDRRSDQKIISLLSGQSLNLNAIAENFDISRPAISQHIKILTECGLIMITQQGRERYCEAKLQKLKEVSDWLEPFKKEWAARFDKLDNLLEKLQQNKKRPGKK